MECEQLITSLYEVVAKVKLLHLSVISVHGGGSASVHAGIPPPCQGDPHQGDPPAKETPGQGDPPPRRPAHQGDPRAKETPLPGSRPAGMHSCSQVQFSCPYRKYIV